MTARVTFEFTGTTVLITGGTSGIGHATATLFRDAGAEVTVTGTRPEADSYETDLTDMQYRQLCLDDPKSIDALTESFDRLDVLINNAGANFPQGLDESRPEGFDASVALNLVGPYRLTVGLRSALRKSTAPGGASVVNLASMAALRAVALVPGYGAQGGGAEGLKGGFDKNGLGAIVNSSRAVMCAYKKEGCDERDFAKAARREAIRMRDDITQHISL